MCSEGSCCGPCCSVRSWFVTHVVFVMLGTISLGGYVAIFSLIPASLETWGDINKYVAENTNGTTWMPFADDELVSYAKMMTIVCAVGFVIGLCWTVVGWVTVCGNNEKALIVYMIFCVIDFILMVALIIAMSTYGDKIDGTTSALGAAFKPNAGLYINYAIHIAVMDVAPMLCFCLCRPKVMSRFADPTKI